MADDDKTVFGQPLPQPPRPSGRDDAQSGQAPARAGEDKTVFGQPLPPAGGGPGRAAPASPQQPRNTPGADDTWLGGAFIPSGGNAQPPASLDSWHQQQPRQPPPAYPQPVRQPIYQPGTGAQAQGSGIFPDIPRETAQPAYAAQPRIALDDALRAARLEAGGSSNPLVAAAANLLILLGRLRSGLVEMQAGPLIDHVTREIDQFERKALEQGVTPQDAQDSKYALSATADDIVQNLPGADRGQWMQYSMAARFFGDRSSGVGFFRKIDEAMKAPGQRFYLLELMLTCLSLGFEGQYRTTQNGGVELARIRTAIYETLRRIAPRPDDDVSPRWVPVALRGKRLRGAVPVWVVAGLAALMLVTLFATLSTLLTRQAAQARDTMLALHAGAPAITIERSKPVITPYRAPESGQLERVRAALADQIAAKQVVVDHNNDWVFVRLGDALRFRSGAADLTNDLTALAIAIGTTLDSEAGPIRVVGHTDSIPVSGRGRYKTNQALSEARAQTMADILSKHLKDPTRISVEGKGASEPIGDNATAKGRASNRRVEIMIPREE